MEKNNQKDTQSNTKPYNLEPNIEAALAYLISPFSGVFVFLMEKENKFVRFHAMQSIIFGIAVFAAMVIANILNVILIGFILGPIVSIASFVVWLVLIYKAYSNIEYELPYLGKFAREQLTKVN